jgi:hypothetical protein
VSVTSKLAVVAEAKSETRLLRVTLIKDAYASTLSTEEMAIWDLRDLILTTTANAKEKLP